MVPYLFAVFKLAICFAMWVVFLLYADPNILPPILSEVQGYRPSDVASIEKNRESPPTAATVRWNYPGTDGQTEYRRPSGNNGRDTARRHTTRTGVWRSGGVSR